MGWAGKGPFSPNTSPIQGTHRIRMEGILTHSGEWFQKDAVSMSRLTGIMRMEDQSRQKNVPDSSWTAGPPQSDRQAAQTGRQAGGQETDTQTGWFFFIWCLTKQERGTLFTFFCLLSFFIVVITNMLYCSSYQGPSLVLQTQGLFDTISLRLFLQFAGEPVYEHLRIIVIGKIYLRLAEFLLNLLYWVLSSWLISCRKQARGEPKLTAYFIT